jgi:radical SAM protein with 4Fe4S-binding SPASM domain
VPTGRAKARGDFLLSQQDYQALLVKILEKQKQTNLELKPVCAPQFVPLARNLGLKLRFEQGCLAGISYCCILPNGDVHPCPYLPIYIGNVRKMKFSLLWEKNEIFQKLRNLDYQARCSDCSHKVSCGGCRGRAYYYSADFIAEDPDCFFKVSGKNSTTTLKC